MPTTIEITQTIIIKDLSDEAVIQSTKPTFKMAPAFVPTSTAAVESAGISILFYARPSGELATLTA